MKTEAKEKKYVPWFMQLKRAYVKILWLLTKEQFLLSQREIIVSRVLLYNSLKDSSWAWNSSRRFYFPVFFILTPFGHYLSVFVVEEIAVMLQHKPPLPPAFHKARVSPLMQVAATGGPWSIRTAAYVGSHHQCQDVWTYRHEFRKASSVA